MEKLGPEILRKYADVLEDKRRMEDVERCIHIPDLDQRLLLALNRTKRDAISYKLPDAGTVSKWLQERLVSVVSPDGQSVVLGLFFTNRTPFNKVKANIAVGIFPLYAEYVDYSIRPEVNLSIWESRGILTLTDKSVPKEDPFLVDNPKGLDFLFFRRSPFNPAQPYKTTLPKDKTSFLPHTKLCEHVLEENVMARALWYTAQGSTPRLFIQDGIGVFLRKNRHDERYRTLCAAFSKRRFLHGYTDFTI